MTHQARKRFGQNFLHDQRIIDHMLAHAQPQADEHWVEIGPGLGALTQPLLQTGISLDVVELDRDLVSHLQQRFSDHPLLRIHSADALRFDFAALASPEQRLRVIGNLPYNISTPLLFHLLETTACIHDMHFMLQKEVVQRMCADPGSKQYGRLSVMLQYFCQPEWLFDVPRESFDPMPQVVSAIVKLTPHATPPVVIDDAAAFNQLVTAAFSQRRKTLRNALKNLLSDSQIASLDIDPQARAETLPLSAFAQLHRLAYSLQPTQ